jgi:hypothetical protein
LQEVTLEVTHKPEVHFCVALRDNPCTNHRSL